MNLQCCQVDSVPAAAALLQDEMPFHVSCPFLLFSPASHPVHALVPAWLQGPELS